MSEPMSLLMRVLLLEALMMENGCVELCTPGVRCDCMDGIEEIVGGLRYE
jgi:hypothetical protein